MHIKIVQTNSGAASKNTSKVPLHLKVLDSLEKLGYNRVEFVHANEFELIYHRPDQIVARQLTILEKK